MGWGAVVGAWSVRQRGGVGGKYNGDNNWKQNEAQSVRLCRINNTQGS